MKFLRLTPWRDAMKNNLTKPPVVLDVPEGWTLKLSADGSRVRVTIVGAKDHRATKALIRLQLLSCEKTLR